MEDDRVGNNNRRSGGAVKKEEDAGDPIVCTGKTRCKSCTAGVIADCVAVCCCPCAVVDILVLALFKVPWTLGRKCLGLPRRKRGSNGRGGGRICNRERGCSYRSDDVVSRMGSVWGSGIESAGFGIEDLEWVKGNFSARFNADEVWLELSEVGHLGFGRVSCTEIPSV
ncbi:unnamed protein product [Cuscuta epithymum]|uniref:Uncharacterized protein n=1 Tax=Cuscuta epithymum TaxID=186058 RepID=A0AAV0EQA6_9ASTE|nr:unnamed protein product [Cuscuta epithymum]